jgi:hypothetical protein
VPRDIIQVLLLGAEIHSFAADFQAEQITVKPKAEPSAQQVRRESARVRGRFFAFEIKRIALMTAFDVASGLIR